MSDTVSRADLLRLTVEVVTAHASHNTFPAETLPAVIRAVYGVLADIKAEPDGAPATVEAAAPHVPAEKTSPPDLPTEEPAAANPPKEESATSRPKMLVPAVPAKNSVFHDHIVCLEDGKKLKMLKGHLQSAHGMTPTQYRRKWGLPDTYPIVAPSHAALRSKLAKKIDFGRKRKAASADVVVQRIPEGVSSKKKRGRPSRQRL